MSKLKVQRWECETNEFCDSDMQKNIIGNYVRYEDYARLTWKPISKMPRPEPYKVEMFFVYRGMVGVGVYAGDDCRGEPMFKIDGGYEDPDFWMPIPSWSEEERTQR